MSSSVERVVEALEAVGASPEGISVTEAARALNMSKAGASRLLASLAESNLVERDTAQRYVLGLRLWDLGTQAARRLRIADISRSLILETARETGAQLHLSVLRGDKAVFLEMTGFVNGLPVPVLPAMPVVPAYACAPGKVMLAALAPDALEAALPAKLEAHTSMTLTSREALRMELSRVREQGYALNAGEYIPSHFGVSVPIYDYTAKVVAAVGCSGYAADFEGGDALRMLPAMLELSHSISALLGYKAGARTVVG